jgi:hypothetical protein
MRRFASHPYAIGAFRNAARRMGCPIAATKPGMRAAQNRALKMLGGNLS